MESWWSSYPDFLTRHVTVRGLINQRIKQSGNGTVFHDRYLIAGDEEVLISNSFNGWRTDGVTFVSLPLRGLPHRSGESGGHWMPGLHPKGFLFGRLIDGRAD